MADLVLVNAFCQVNILKGFRYLDDAGKIMNRYDDDFAEKSVGLNGLDMSTKKEDAILREMRVSSRHIWLRFSKPDTYQYVIDHGSSRIREVADIIDVSSASRFGVRLEYLYPVRDAAIATRSAAGAIFKESFVAGGSEANEMAHDGPYCTR